MNKDSSFVLAYILVRHLVCTTIIFFQIQSDTEMSAAENAIAHYCVSGERRVC